ncbi:MAG: Spi family protease inhibitor [Prevotella sp.]|nr:Spi family protease inhibitor [Prevotella sp.]MCM1075425.1 Spi family protease inhibitor [Ruminococcus sp.]
MYDMTNETPNTGEQVQSGNPYRVSLDDALSVADKIMGDIEISPTRKSRTIRNVKYVTEPNTRSGATDTLLYVVNYDDDMGFAVLGADVRSQPVYAIASEGEFNLSDSTTNPGLEMLYAYYQNDAARSIRDGNVNPGDSLFLPDPYPGLIKPDFGERTITIF